MAQAVKCPICEGSGKVLDSLGKSQVCHGCGGRGWVEVRDTPPYPSPWWPEPPYPVTVTYNSQGIPNGGFNKPE